MIGAAIGGAVGMIFAVPVYSILKIVLGELFAPYYVEPEPVAETPQTEQPEPVLTKEAGKDDSVETMTSILSIRFMKRQSCRKLQNSQ